MASDERILLTVLLHHDQSKTLDEIMAHAKKTGFYRAFRYEVFPSYDFSPIAAKLKQDHA
jgi:translation initiation factor 2B subunit (eIF-2B alpha/beta/delta family)